MITQIKKYFALFLIYFNPHTSNEICAFNHVLFHLHILIIKTHARCIFYILANHVTTSSIFSPNSTQNRSCFSFADTSIYELMGELTNTISY